jgi:L-fucono-1,5-lactonase
MVSPIIDAHQHVWDLARANYPWLGREPGELNRTFGFKELRGSLERSGVNGTVLVQAADNAEDTALMFDTAAENPEVVGIVAYAPIDRPDDVAKILDELKKNSLTVGIRTLIHNQADPDWLLGDKVNEGLSLLEDADLAFDVVSVLPRHLELVPLLSERHPRLRMAIDHLSKPPIGLESSQPWWDLIAAAAQNPLVYAKVSGLYSATGDPASWTVDEVRPHFDHALEVFGADRLMYGGDWPVSVIAGGYDRVWDGLQELFSALGQVARNDVLGDTASRFYRIDPQRIAKVAK